MASRNEDGTTKTQIALMFHHTGTTIVETNAATDTVVERIENTSVRPPDSGE